MQGLIQGHVDAGFAQTTLMMSTRITVIAMAETVMAQRRPDVFPSRRTGPT